MSACFRIHLVPVYREAAEPVAAEVVAVAVVELPAAPVVEVVRLLRRQRIPAEFMAQAAACVFRAG